ASHEEAGSWPTSRGSSARANGLDRVPHGGACCRRAWRSARWRWGTGGPGTYELNAMPFDQGHASPTGPLARVVVAGEPLSMKLPTALPKPPLEAIRDSEITGGRALVCGPTEPQNNIAGHWQEYAFTVDAKTFDPSRIDQ